MRALLTAGVLLGACFLSASATSQGTPKQPGAPRRREVVDVKPAIEKLKSNDEAQVKAGLDDVRIAGPGGTAAAPTIVEILDRGLSLPLTEAAIETLAD